MTQEEKRHDVARQIGLSLCIGKIVFCLLEKMAEMDGFSLWRMAAFADRIGKRLSVDMIISCACDSLNS